MKIKNTHIVKSLFNSLAGLRFAWGSEIAFRQNTALVAVGCVLMWFIPCGFVVRLILFLTLVLILMAELTNTAIEKTIDRVGTEYHELAKAAKDLGSALVFISLMCAAVVWCVVAVKYLF